MSSDNHSRKPQSWEHLLEKDPHSGAGFGLGVAAAVLIHAAVFAVTWPTVAQAPPEEPEQVLYPVPIYDFVPERPEPEPIIEIELPPAPPEASLILPGPPPEDSGEPIERDHPEPPPTGPAVYVVPVDPPPPPPDPPPTIVTADFEIAAPEIEDRVEPHYTEPARHAGIEGVVIVELVIDVDGAVESVKVHRGLPLGLTQNAVDAVRQWRFAPSTYNGHPVAVRYILTVRFNLT
jgi:protein TonB